MKKLFICVFVVILFLVCGVSPVMAAWYNPFSWFNKAPKTDYSITPIQPEQTPTLTNPSLSLTSTTPIITEKVIEKIDNPELKKQISQLVKENNLLKQQLADTQSVKNQLSACQSNLTKSSCDYSSYINQLKPAIESFRAKYDDLYTNTENLLTAYKKLQAEKTSCDSLLTKNETSLTQCIDGLQRATSLANKWEQLYHSVTRY
jgi:uncharacterized protein YukE